MYPEREARLVNSLSKCISNFVSEFSEVLKHKNIITTPIDSKSSSADTNSSTIALYEFEKIHKFKCLNQKEKSKPPFLSPISFNYWLFLCLRCQYKIVASIDKLKFSSNELPIKIVYKNFYLNVCLEDKKEMVNKIYPFYIDSYSLILNTPSILLGEETSKWLITSLEIVTKVCVFFNFSTAIETLMVDFYSSNSILLGSDIKQTNKEYKPLRENPILFISSLINISNHSYNYLKKYWIIILDRFQQFWHFKDSTGCVFIYI